jgi:uncharacterized membrane protein
MATPSNPSSELPEAITGTGTDLTRILSLSDGIFGFAMTLLIVNLAIPTYSAVQVNPDLATYLSRVQYGVLAYVEAFFVIVAWWAAHHQLFGVIRRYDRILIRLNNVFLLSISLTPFLLALVTSYGPAKIDSMGASAKLSVLLFSLLEVSTGALLWAIWKYVHRVPGMVDPRVTPFYIDLEERQSLNRVALFGASAVVALVLPEVAIWMWMAVLLGGGRKKPATPKTVSGAPLARSTTGIQGGTEPGGATT